MWVTRESLSWTGTSSKTPQGPSPQTGEHSLTPAESHSRCLPEHWTPTGLMTGLMLRPTSPLSRPAARIRWTLLMRDGSVRLPATLLPKTTYCTLTASPLYPSLAPEWATYWSMEDSNALRTTVQAI